MREVHTYKLDEINKTRNKREISRMCTPVPRIKCPCTLLAGRYRLTHEAAYTTIIMRSACGGWSPWSWFLTMADKAKRDRVRNGGASRAIACKMHNIVKFHYRYNNASLIRRAMRRLVGWTPVARIAQCPAPYDVPRDTRGSHIWNSLRYGRRKACVRALISRFCSGNY